MINDTPLGNRYKDFENKWKDNPDAISFLNVVEKGNQCVFLTGKAGTGKSELVKDIIHIYSQEEQTPLILWSTGISALNVWWQTVHSFFSLWIENIKFQDIKHYILDNKNKKYKLKKSKIEILKKVPFIVIDEISMVSSNIIDCVNFMMKYYLAKETGNTELISKPFGWKKIIFVGDLFQLPPVRTRDRENKIWKFYTSEWFFDSIAFKNLNYVGIELKKSYRQKNDQYFAEILDAIRYEEFTDEHIKVLNTQKTHEYDKEIVLLSTHRSKVSNINDRRLSELWWEEEIMYASSDWIFPDSMKKVEEVLKLKIGAKVMLLTNDGMEKRWVNWSVGIIKDIVLDDYEDEEYLEINIDGRHVYVKKHRRENKIVSISNWKLTEKILWSYTQFPIQLAYAMTIHKSQWLTFDRCQLDLSNTFTGWQAYTALSRSRTLDWLKIFWEIKKEHIFFDKKIKTFIQDNFKKRIYNDNNDKNYTENHEHEDFEEEIIDLKINLDKKIKEKKEKNDDILLDTEDTQLFEELRKLRLDLARQEWMPPYIVFSDKVLKNITKTKPQNKEEMLKIKWIRERKFEKYGQIFIDKIKELWI